MGKRSRGPRQNTIRKGIDDSRKLSQNARHTKKHKLLKKLENVRSTASPFLGYKIVRDSLSYNERILCLENYKYAMNLR